MRHTLTGPSGRQQKGNCFVVLLVCLAAQKKAKKRQGTGAGKGGGVCVYKVADLTCDTFCQRVSMGRAFCLLLLALEAVKRLGPQRTLGSLLSVCVCVYLRVCVHKSQMPLHT